MAIIQLNGRITEDGLEIELPSGLPQGEARITIELPVEPTWTTEELNQALEAVPMSGAEIVDAGLTGGWSSAGILSGEDWVREKRDQRFEERRRR